MVPAVVVMPVAALAIASVPNLLDGPHGLGLAAVHLFNQKGIHLLAVVHPGRGYLQSLVKKVVLAGDDVHKVPYALRRVVRAVQVDVNAAAAVGEGTRLAQPAHQFLQALDVLVVGKDGADQFNAVLAGGGDLAPALLTLAVDAAVAHDLPNPAIGGRDLLGVVIVAGTGDRTAEVFGRDLGGLAARDAREFNLNPESACKHCGFLLSVYVLCPSACTYITLKGLYSKRYPR